MRRLAPPLALALLLAGASGAQEIVPIPEAMKLGAPTSYALVRCAGVARATADWIAATGGDPALAKGLAERAAAFVQAAARAGEAAETETDAAAASWTARFAASGRAGDAAWKADPVWAKDMVVCDDIAAAAR